MTCDELREGEWLERYVARTLTDEEQALVEAHYFDCADCFAEVQALLALRGELARQGAPQEAPAGPRWTHWLPLAAGLALGLTAGLAFLATRPAQPTQTAVNTPAVQSEHAPPASTSAQPAAVQDATTPVTAGQPAAPAAEPAASPGPDLRSLARFKAPAFLALTIRGTGEGQVTDLAQARAAYGRGDFAAAARLLAALPADATGQPQVEFYRGISLLQSGNTAAGIAALSTAAGSGQAPYAVEAHYYLARGHLASGNLGAARAALRRYVELDGDDARGARALLAQLGR